MNFKDNLNRICAERGTKLSPVLSALGYSTSKTTAINNGQIPKEDTLLELARYLNCSVMDFFADEDEISELPTLPCQPKDEDEEDILRIFRSLSRKRRHEFMAMVYEFEDKGEMDGDKTNAVNE